MARIPVVIPHAVGGGPATRYPGVAQHREHLGRPGNVLQAGIRASTQRASSNPFGDGNMLTAVTFTANTPLVLSHGLGRATRGFLTLNQVGAAGKVWSVAQASALAGASMTLQSDTTMTCDVWIY